jgi:hypothetical protein
MMNAEMDDPTSYSRSDLSDREYRDSMDCPMEDLAVALWGVTGDGPGPLKDAQIVEWAARKITMMRDMLKATGMNEALIQATLDK